MNQLSLEQLCGQLLIVGFDGTELPPSLADAIRAGHRGGVILFRRNLPDIETTWRLCRAIRDAFPPGIPPLIALDEEGGRVSRLPPPFERLAPMRWFGEQDDLQLTLRAGAWLGRQLARIGFTWNFAPVLDVDSNPDNPIIGDRSFSRDPAVVARHGQAFIAGLQGQGIAACGKHFPGHGDTHLDSHVDLPWVDHSRQRLEALELAPFRDCAQSGLAGMMTAHVVYPSLDPTRVPATFSREILTGILREQYRFPGVIFSDDLEMGAVARHQSVESAALLALRAGCDGLLICHSEGAAERTHTALIDHACRDSTLAHIAKDSASRLLEIRRRFVDALGESVATALSSLHAFEAER